LTVILDEFWAEELEKVRTPVQAPSLVGGVAALGWQSPSEVEGIETLIAGRAVYFNVYSMVNENRR